MADDAQDDFQAKPDDTNPMTDMTARQQLPQDHDTPFSPPDGVQDRIDDTHQTTDTNITEHQQYDEGIEGASGIDMPGQAADENPEPGQRI